MEGGDRHLLSTLSPGLRTERAALAFSLPWIFTVQVRKGASKMSPPPVSGQEGASKMGPPLVSVLFGFSFVDNKK